ncbi:protease modulator HflC [Parvibaculum sedimenti]|uniref:Protein HflC n=1 Tax=Parvibaculum sedimenti TaxID=2608632 RepID=A0A6N6VFE9_9HYPH|nr:protease modulator HflC [Parvibaculum sedimenti]KAB7738956.1 protease modulator HflC [Parvibaculum sedimenti]
MNRSVGIGVIAALIVAALAAYLSLFTVNMTQQAIVLQFGRPVGQVITEPGLYVKVPLIQNVVYIDKRLLNLESPTEEIIASDQKRLVVDAFARYRIVDALKFYQAVRDPRLTETRLQPSFGSALRNTLGDNSLEALVRDNRAGLMRKIQENFNKTASDLGIEIVDVRIRRADLPEANSQAIFRRMQTEREREAAEIRAQGQEQAQRIRSKADRDVTVLLADAERDGQIARGEGDATQNKIYAEAFGQDPEFFAFYRSMQAYKKAIKSDNSTMVVGPDSEFFRYFGNEAGTGAKR